MIARNEEHHLPRALASVRPFAGQIIVCDTGSTDRTAEIAHQAGAQVLQHRWDDDFAAARNVALGAAEQPWVLSLDADEEVVPASVSALEHALSADAAGQLVHIHLLGAPEAADGAADAATGAAGSAAPARASHVLSALRLFRRDPRIRFRGRVHETVAESLLQLGQASWPDSFVHLSHHGYAAEAERRRKSERNLHLLRLAHGETPEDLFIGYKLALTLPSDDTGERLRLLRDVTARAASLPPAERGTYPFLPRLLSACCDELLRIGALSEAGRVAERGAERFGPACAFTAGRVLLRVGELDRADEALRRYLNAPHNGGHTGLLQVDPLASLRRAWHLLGQAELLRERPALDRARSWLQRAAAPAAGESVAGEPLAGEPAALGVAITCDLARVWLRAGRLQEAAAGLTAASVAAEARRGAGGDPQGLREVMLLSGELALRLGDVAGAVPLLRAAVDPSAADERGATRLVGVLLGQGDLAGAQALLPVLPGGDYQAQAARLVLQRLLGAALPAVQEQPPAVLQAQEALWRALPAGLRSHS